MSNKNIVVAFGGVSPEHEVSVLTAMQAITSLEDTNHSILPLYITKSGRWMTGDVLLDLENYQDLNELADQAIPCTFDHDDMGKPVLQETQKKNFFSSTKYYPIYALIPSFHGSEGENGAFQGCCEMYNIPYAGSGVLASSLGMDKVKAKELCQTHKIPVVDGFDFYEHQWAQYQPSLIEKADMLGYPLIIKPVTLGSSIGVSRAENQAELIEEIENSFRYDDNLMVEKAETPLMEINCSVMGSTDEVRYSVCERHVGETETLSFEDKYQSDGNGEKGMACADRVIPADISEELSEKIQSIAEKTFRAFRASGIARLDFLVNADTHQLYFNEINSIPGPFSFYLWEESGMNMRELMLKLIEVARQRHQKKNGRIRSYDTNLLSEKAVKGIKGLKGDK